jgi:hypothetical protein
MAPLLYQINMEIKDIKVDERYFSFKWKALVNAKSYRGKYESDYDSQTAEQLRKTLEKGFAFELSLEELLSKMAK